MPAPVDLFPVAAAPFVGSFLGTLACRLPVGRPVALARSACPGCGHALGPLSLIPLLSWAMQRGRCRHCSARIEPFYPLIELLALALALSAVAVFSGWMLWVSCGLGWCLLALAATDIRHTVLPDALTLPLIPAGLAVVLVGGTGAFWLHLAAAAGAWLACVALASAYRRLRGRDGLGMGDAKLLAAAGAWLGPAALPGVVLAASAAALCVVLARDVGRRRIAAATLIPFGPFLALAIWLSWLYGPLLPPWSVP